MKVDNNLCACCQEYKSQLYQIADCGHRFCKECCIAYINSQAENFAKAKCLQEGCQAQLNAKKPIYNYLDQTTKNRIENYKLFLYLQSNKDAIACRKKDCKGYFLKSANLNCSLCSSLHCQKCLELQHPGTCISKKDEENAMKQLNYRKCPKCSIWVQKIAGCEFINCKCGIQFCFRCGEEYSKDPCRKAVIWKKQSQIRQLMTNLHFKSPSNIPDLFLLMFQLLVLVLIVVPFTVIYCAVPLLIGVGLIQALVFLFMPLLPFYGVSQTQDCKCRGLAYALLVVFYPVIGAFFALVALIIILLYPFARNKYHHGVYDPLDSLISHMTVYYLKFINLVIICCCKQLN